MPRGRPRVFTDEQSKKNHIAAVDKYRRANATKHNKWSNDYYHRNKDKIAEKRRLKKDAAKAALLKIKIPEAEPIVEENTTE